jgi:primosomal protein N' (replication factor Y)
MKYVEVLPLTQTGGENIFTYETDLEPKVGSIVSVPLRNRYIRGMVLKYVGKPKFKTKEVKKIQSEEQVLSDIQLLLAEKIAEYYFCNLSDVISAMLPFDFGKKRRELKDEKKQQAGKEEKFKLTKDQKEIYTNISDAKPKTKHLLFGVTGSGKTEIYLQLIEKGLKEGKGAIVLVPEISLTPQATERFEKRFGDKVAVWHSGLLETEKYATWQKIKAGEKKVILGARSAIFAPIRDLGYIIIDEEHEGSYKQDQTPRYETGRVAEWLTDLSGAKLVLGSATPKIETFKKAKDKEYALHTMKKRIVQDEMPPVKVVDLRDEFRKGNKSIISDDLFEAMDEALKEKKQVLLFVNRRGASTFVVCRDCGFVSECPNCEIPLTYHPSEGQVLKCHHCDYRTKVPVICPTCKSHAIRYFGLGTQRTEIEVKKMFPKATVSRMDKDTTSKRGSHEALYTDFATKKSDILIGTQIIAKGWDLPNVAVVGVISADTMLNLPDFRSGEKTFSLLTQVAGRTGRGYHPGKVVIQTYNPESYAIKAAAGHDYIDFYEREIKDREKYSYPPFSILIRLLYSQKTEGKVITETDMMADKLAIDLADSDIDILGPSAAFLPKLAGKYRYQIVLKVKKGEKLKKTLEIIKKNYKAGWIVDVNPASLL